MKVTADLAGIVRRKKLDLTARKKTFPLSRLEKLAAKSPAVRNFRRLIRKKGRVSLIAEMKKASPSAGMLRVPYDPAYLAAQYHEGGASALSVLTEENYFEGRLEHVLLAKKACPLPVLRKDFLFEPYQVYESRAAGADAVLLIAAILKDGELKDLIGLTETLGMTPLVEVHDEVELARSLAAGAKVIGVNSRNLKDLTVNPDIFRKISPKIPEDKIAVAESGIKTEKDVKAVRQLHFSSMLVGESLLRQADACEAARTLVEAGGG